ncbi:MAG TPA: ECF transporter S component [Candidatus Limiplasma sp.]|nr:ECF transporter S component [Candidatus Limiplasma sp.]
MSEKLTTKTIALAGMLAALIFLATWLFKVPVASGYIHLGDGFILIAASMLGWPAVLAAALGSALADLLAGYSIYMLPTFLIKGAMAAVAVWGCTRQTQPVKMLYMLLAEAVMVVGYFFTDFLLYNWAAATGGLIGNLLQGLSGVAVWILLMPVVKRIQKQY